MLFQIWDSMAKTPYSETVLALMKSIMMIQQRISHLSSDKDGVKYLKWLDWLDFRLQERADLVPFRVIAQKMGIS